uniref:Uncharacterized protein n=1 Tax=Ananas comosus var. bracteatus TaxID=296719 RepID=A0A6V7QB92_ANACO|nr:unnamed protein product [Ananas comosus var. bracteatus]
MAKSMSNTTSQRICRNMEVKDTVNGSPCLNAVNSSPCLDTVNESPCLMQSYHPGRGVRNTLNTVIGSPCLDTLQGTKSASYRHPLQFPSPLPTWPSGGGFATGTIDLGGLEVRQVSTFTKVWATLDGSPGDVGAGFFNPTEVPADFYSLGSYAQPNDRPLNGWVLVARDAQELGILAEPLDYTLVWSAESTSVKRVGDGFFWLPTPPSGYKAVGLLVTDSAQKPRSTESAASAPTSPTNRSPTRRSGPPTTAASARFEHRKSVPPRQADARGHVYRFSPVDILPVQRPREGESGIFEHLAREDRGACGDWEHVTLRVSNFGGELRRVYYAAHSAGEWVDASQAEYDPSGGNKPVAYASLHGHAAYAKAGLVLQGDEKLHIGIRNDTAKGKKMDTAGRWELVAAEYDEVGEAVAEPAWLEYMREWGPKTSYDIAKELKGVERLLPKRLRRALEKLVAELPAEVLGRKGRLDPRTRAVGRWMKK